MRVGAFASLLFAAAVACLHTGEDRAEAALRADRDRIAADAQRLELLLDDSLRYTHANGRIDDKASLIESLVSGRVDYRSIELELPEVRVRGDSAIVSGPVRMEVAVGEHRLRLASVYTAVYWWRAGRWQLVAYQSTAADPR